jgi:hypothetical protein
MVVGEGTIKLQDGRRRLTMERHQSVCGRRRCGVRLAWVRELGQRQCGCGRTIDRENGCGGACGDRRRCAGMHQLIWHAGGRRDDDGEMRRRGGQESGGVWKNR